MNYSALLIKMLIFAVLILIGYAMARKGILGSEFLKGASYLLVNVFIIASILNSILGERPQMSMTELLFALGMLVLYMVICFGVARIAAFPFREADNVGQLELLMSVGNNLFFGLPALTSVAGNEAAIYVGMSCVAFNLVVYSYGVWRLKKGTGKVELKDLFNPLQIASLLALVLYILNPPIPTAVKELISAISGGSLPLSMIVIGASMGTTNLLKAFSEAKVYYIALIRLIVAPVVAFFLLRPLIENPILLLTCTVLAGCPVAAISTPLSIQYGYDGNESSKAVTVTTLLSILTVPLLIWVLF